MKFERGELRNSGVGTGVRPSFLLLVLPKYSNLNEEVYYYGTNNKHQPR